MRRLTAALLLILLTACGAPAAYAAGCAYVGGGLACAGTLPPEIGLPGAPDQGVPQPTPEPEPEAEPSSEPSPDSTSPAPGVSSQPVTPTGNSDATTSPDVSSSAPIPDTSARPVETPDMSLNKSHSATAKPPAPGKRPPAPTPAHLPAHTPTYSPPGCVYTGGAYACAGMWPPQVGPSGLPIAW